VTFDFSFTGQEKAQQLMYIAFTYPFSYEDCNAYFDNVQRTVENTLADKVYIHRELLTYSMEQRNVELITITGHNDRLEELEEGLPGLFPEFD